MTLNLAALAKEPTPDTLPPIERGEPIPVRYEGPRARAFRVMEPGEHRTFVCSPMERRAWRLAAGGVGKRMGWKFASKTVETDAGTAVRIWREK